MEAYIAGFDVGTSSAKAILYSVHENSVVFQRTIHYGFEVDATGQVLVRLSKVVEAVRTLLEGIGKFLEDHASGAEVYVTFDTMLHSLILLDSEMRPLTEIIPWMNDTGKLEALKVLNSELAPQIHRTTGCPIATTYPLYKLVHFTRFGREKLEGVAKVASIKDYIMYVLTGEHVVDPSIASGSSLLDIRRRRWAEGIVSDLTGLRGELLPEIVPFDTILEPTAETLVLLGKRRKVKILVGTSDGAASSMGTTLGSEDLMTLSMGTSAAFRRVLGSPPPDEAMNGFGPWCYIFDEHRYIVGSATNNCGNVLSWWAGELLGRNDFAHFEKVLLKFLSDESPGGNGPYFRPTVFGMRSPRWLPDQTAEFYNVRGNHGLDEFTYAVLEGLAFKFRRAIELVETTTSLVSGEPRGYVGTGGLLQIAGWGQFLATAIGRSFYVQKDRYDAAFGTILFALRTLRSKGIVEDSPKVESAQILFKPSERFVEFMNARYAEWLDRMEKVERESLNELRERLRTGVSLEWKRS